MVELPLKYGPPIVEQRSTKNGRKGELVAKLCGNLSHVITESALGTGRGVVTTTAGTLYVLPR